MRRLGCIALISITFAAACERGPEETYGFIATLGNDTTSIERISRWPDRIVGDAVGRAPMVVRRRWEARLNDDGSIRSWTLDTNIPNATTNNTLHHEVVVDGNTVRVVRQVGDSIARFSYRFDYPALVPWNAFVFGTYEPLFAAAQSLPDTATVGIYFFEGWAEGRLGFARVRPRGGDSVALMSTGLAGSGVARIDERGRMFFYSGEGTTDKQQVQRVENVPDLDEVEQRFAANEQANGVNRRLSPPDTTRVQLGTTTVAIEYGRPLARGRRLFGGLVPYGQVWRTGANEATHLHVSGPVKLGGVALDSGSYTLWTIPAPNDVQLIINSQTGQWGTAYRSQYDVARVPMQIDTTLTPVEQFTIRIDTAQNAAPAQLIMEWGSLRWSVPIETQ